MMLCLNAYYNNYKDDAMDIDVNDMFDEPCSVDNTVLDIDVPKAQNAIVSLPDDFQITAKSDIRILQEFISHNYAKGICLYRGHESRDYKIESTIVRLLNQKDTNCSIQHLLAAEKKAFNLFCHDVFKEEWLHNKLEKSDEDLFKMSIGRHLGLPCRLIDVTASLEIAIWFAVMNPKFYNMDGEVILFVLNKDDVAGTGQSPFYATKKVSYANEPFMTDSSLNDLPLGEQRRFVQFGRFIWVDDNSLLSEQQIISDTVFHIRRFIIPWSAKLPLAVELYRDIYSGCAYQSEIAKIKECI